uniref:Uncharacterized protein n=1 Tax=Anguilla anguilla TaxID=7936 RepID=A0A0E9R9Z1_ANGAN
MTYRECSVGMSNLALLYVKNMFCLRLQIQLWLFTLCVISCLQRVPVVSCFPTELLT